MKITKLGVAFFKKIALFAFPLSIFDVHAQSVLMFIPQEQTYYSEYIVMREALEAAGYAVDVRSATGQPASLYMLPAGIDINGTANSLPTGGSYAQFTQQFQNLFGSSWDATLNIMPANVAVNGSIQSITDMTPYEALIVVGGLGSLEYRVDGIYAPQGVASAAEVQAAAEKLNQLALEALSTGKPVLGECHAASIVAFWRIPGTSGPGAEALGYSLLKDQYATGYPEPETTTTLANLGIVYRASDRVTIASPHGSFADAGNGNSKIITTQDWYPQTVAYAARTLLNVLETYPPVAELQNPVSVLLLHGGMIDAGNCSPVNKANDIPCNYGNDIANLPADYTDLLSLLTDASPNDDYSINVTDINLTAGGLPFNVNNANEIAAVLGGYQVVVFFKHWATGVTNALQNALVQYADNGGGVLLLHHGLYNEPEGALNKDILTEQLAGAEAASGVTFSSGRATHRLFHTNYGHFVTTYSVPLSAAQPSLQTPVVWNAQPLIPVANASFSYYQNFELYDELYGNMTFLPGQVFGRGVNEITPLLSANTLLDEEQVHTAGFLKFFDSSDNGTVGKVVYYQPGERPDNYTANHSYGQIIRNTVVWLASDVDPVLSSENFPVVLGSDAILYPNPTYGTVNLLFRKAVANARVKVYNMQGKLIQDHRKVHGTSFSIDMYSAAGGLYFVEVYDMGVVARLKLLKR